MKLALPVPSRKSLPALITMLVFVGVYVSGLWYVRHLEGVVRTKSAELGLAMARETALRNMGGFLEEIKADAAMLDSFFASPDQAVTAIEQVEGLGALLGTTVRISNVRIDDKNAETGEGIMTMDITAGGSWGAINDLMALLDAFPYASRIDEAEVTKIADAAEDGSSQWRLRAHMRLWLRR